MHVADASVYATDPETLRRQIRDLLAAARPDPVDGDIEALIVPFGNHLAGGPASAAAFRLLADRTADFDTAIVVAPSLDEAFDRIAIARANTYRTPLGSVPVDDRLRNELCDEDDDIFLDDRGHYTAGGVDAQLPFLQEIFGERLSVVPIVMGRETPAFCHELGSAVGEVMYGRRAVLVACADLLAFEEGALERFTEALEAFDTSALMHLLGSERVHVRGMGAVIVAAIAAQRRRANRARILHLQPPRGEHPGALSAVFWRA